MYQVPHKKSIKSVRFLANHDKNLLQEQGNQGTTPLILAIIYEFTEIIIYLVEEAQLTIPNNNCPILIRHRQAQLLPTWLLVLR